MVRKYTTIAESVEHTILKYIADNGLRNGDKLPPEKNLAETLGISRHSLREGLSRLRAMNLLSANKRGGTVFRRPEIFSSLELICRYQLMTLDLAVDLMRFRILMELGAAKYIYRNHTAADLRELRALCRVRPETQQEFYENHLAFHQRLFRIGGGRISDNFNTLLLYSFRVTGVKEHYERNNTPDGYVEEMAAHQALCEVLKNGTEEEFCRALSGHFESYNDLFDPNSQNPDRFKLEEKLFERFFTENEI